MQPDTVYFHSAARAAVANAWRVARRIGLSAQDREDVEQEILLELLERESRYDAARGMPGTFTGRVSKNRAAELNQAIVRDRMHLSFVGGDDADESASDGFDALPLWGETSNFCDAVGAARDIDSAMALMDDAQRTLFGLLVEHQDLPAACRVSGLSTATFYRRVADLQMHLRMFGFASPAGSPSVTLLRKQTRSPGNNNQTPQISRCGQLTETV